MRNGGKRGYLGLLVPSSNTSTELDYLDWLPSGVSLHSARMYMHDASLAACRALVEEHAPRAARELATLEPDVVVFSCTGAGALLGEQGEAELVERLAEIAGVPVVSTNEAVSRMIDAHSPSRIAVLTPYVPEVVETVVAARERAGHRVVYATGMGIATNREIGRVDPEEVLEFAEAELRDVEFDLLFVSCTNLRTAPVLEPLERRFGVPVVTSNLASCHAALEAMGAVRA
jgi:maleate isomerase